VGHVKDLQEFQVPKGMALQRTQLVVGQVKEPQRVGQIRKAIRFGHMIVTDVQLVNVHIAAQFVIESGYMIMTHIESQWRCGIGNIEKGL